MFSVASMNSLFWWEIYRESESSKELRRKGISVNGTKANFKLDSRADVSVISEEIYSQLNAAIALQKPDKQQFGPCKTPLIYAGKCEAKLQNIGNCWDEVVYVVIELNQPLLGRSASYELRKIARKISVELKDSGKMCAEKSRASF